MRARSESKGPGVCYGCDKRFASQQIREHVGICPVRPAGTKPAFDLKASAGPYWLYLRIPAPSTLEHLDAALRQIWLECCGHLSRFTIKGDSYDVDGGEVDALLPDFPGDPPRHGMNATLQEVLRPGLIFDYEYDFGSTTKLKLEVVAESRGSFKKCDVLLMARNDPLRVPCSSCGKKPPALVKEVCGACGQMLCGACAKSHRCGEEMLLPLINSPRSGVCGYTGPD